LNYQEKYPDESIVSAIHRAIEECNALISTKSIVSEITGLTLYNPKFYRMPGPERKYLARKVTDYMAERYEMYACNARGPTWRVK
jgi:hypothetical protein